MRRINFMWLMLFGILIQVQAQMRAVSFYEVKPVDRPPVLDGKLDDPCWGEANRHTAYYEYFKPNPGPGVLRTEFRMLYDQKGLYLGVINYEKQIGEIKKNITDRDNPQLWTDDSAELYFDNYGNGIGFRKFMVNAIGTMSDMRRLDGAVSLPEWNGNGWMAKASINPDSWSFEAFFPWEDLGEAAQPGSLWMFCHTRFSFVGGKFRGVTSSPGGNYNATGNFGYLYFLGKDEKCPPDKLADILNRRVTPPWGLGLDNQMIFNLGQGVRIAGLNDLIQKEQQAMNELMGQLEPVLQKASMQKFRETYRKLKNEYAALEQDGERFSRYRAIKSIYQRLKTLQWQIDLEKDFN